MVRGSDDLHATEHCPDTIDKGYSFQNFNFCYFFFGGFSFLFFSFFTAFRREGEGCLPDNFAVDGAGYAVLQLEIHLGNCVFGEDGSIRDIT